MIHGKKCMAGSILNRQIRYRTILSTLDEYSIDPFSLTLAFQTKSLSLESVALESTIDKMRIHGIHHTNDGRGTFMVDRIHLEGTSVHVYREI